MKKFPIKLTVAFISIIVGIVLTVTFLFPSYSKETKVINKYVKALNASNSEKMQTCMATAEDLVGSSEVEDLLGGLMSIDDSEADSSSKNGTKMAMLESSVLSCSLPENASEVKKIKLLGCTASSTKTQYGMTAVSCDVLFEVKYTVTDSDGKESEQTTCFDNEIYLIKGKSGCKISG